MAGVNRRLENVNNNNNNNRVVRRSRDVNNNDIVDESDPDTVSASETESDLEPDRDIDAELHAAWERVCVNMVRLRHMFGRPNARNAPRTITIKKLLQQHRHGRRRPE
ncbi:unnamed protein product [Macrosiphum euphorbiae]|uniref:Uncharacterized protein n=1 Tax=Macrosiphum euphorbiae TaxID=13131 RepID=A0AAV0YAT2_9HEMI|nr:unnamed protein product [Macrosiphum euphorbiae]